MKPISPRAHGMLDYATVLLFLVAPSLLGLSGTPALIAYVLAGAHLLLTVLTAYELGLLKLIPFSVHRVVELVVGIVLLLLPWLAGFADVPAARNFYIAMAIIIVVVVALTRFTLGHEMPARG